jgi:hypothetical protein
MDQLRPVAIVEWVRVATVPVCSSELSNALDFTKTWFLAAETKRHFFVMRASFFYYLCLPSFLFFENLRDLGWFSYNFHADPSAFATWVFTSAWPPPLAIAW